MNTFSLKASECKQDWIKVDAKGMILGRLASLVAHRLKGKHKATYTPHMMCGDKVVIINCDLVALSGKKKKQKIYYRHTGYMGGLKKTTYEHLKDKKFAVEEAIKCMLKKSTQRNAIMKNMRLYNSDEEVKQTNFVFKADIKMEHNNG